MKAALGLTLLVAGVYLFTASGHLDGQDQEYYYRMARAIAHEGSFAIQPLVFQNTEIAGARGRDGRFYPQYAPALPVALAPWVMLAESALPFRPSFARNYQWLHEGETDVTARVLVSYFNVPVMALSAGLLVLLLQRLGYSYSAGVFVGASFALCTFAWGQARIINPEPLQTLLILTAVLLTSDGTTKRAFIGSCALGAAVLVKITSVLALPALLILPNYGKTVGSSKSKIAAAIVLPVLTGLSIYAFYNYVRFGNLFATGYNISGAAGEVTGNRIGNPLTGLFGLLFSTGRGLIWYAPPVLAGLIGCAGFFHEKKRMAIALALLAASWIVLHSCFQAWDSGWGWGPRYLLPILPFILVPAAEAWKRRIGKVFCVALAIVGFLIQIPGALIDFMASGRAGMTLFGQSSQDHSATAFVAWRNFQIAGSEIVRHFALLKQGEIDLAWQTFSDSPLPKVTLMLAAILAVSGSALLFSAWSLNRRQSQNLGRATP